MKLNVDLFELDLAAARMQNIELRQDEFVTFAASVIDGFDRELAQYLGACFNQVATGQNLEAGGDFNTLIKDHIRSVIDKAQL